MAWIPAPLESHSRKYRRVVEAHSMDEVEWPPISASPRGSLRVWCKQCEAWVTLRNVTCPECFADLDTAGGNWMVINADVRVWCKDCHNFNALNPVNTECPKCFSALAEDE